MTAIAHRRCGGTLPRKAYIAGELSVPYDAGKQGCGHLVNEVEIPATPAADEDARPLFVRTAMVTVCPYCDGPSPGAVDVDDLEGPAR
jgi:hypothetical protein